jgi:two-component system, NarL family, sensor histidine kinase LiaS
MRSIFSIFRRLQWKLTISYAFVTAATVILLAIFLVGLAIYAESQNNTRTYDSFYWSKTVFQDNIPYLLDDPAALQTWLDRVRESGFTWQDFKGYTVRESLDYAGSVLNTPIYVLDLDLNLIASSPAADPALVGKPFLPTTHFTVDIQPIVEAALVGDKNYYAQSILASGDSYTAAFPLRKGEGFPFSPLSDSDPVVAIVIYQLKPINFATQTNLEIYSLFLFTTVSLVVAFSFPVGAIFGWLASRGLRKRLTNLSHASRAWSKGDFSVSPGDKSGDEIGELTRNLVSMAEQLQTLISTRNELTRMEERNRLARDLHDTIKQETYAARMQLTAARNLIASNPQAAAEHIESALQLNREIQQELKLIIDELRPAALAGKGLAQAITEYVARWQEHTGIKVDTNINNDCSLPLDIEQGLYRVLQESLSNVARHAEADSVSIALEIAPDKVALSIADNGHGFDPASVPAHSYGLSNMKQRLAEVNGTLTVESTLATGTKVIAEIQQTTKGTK